MKCVYWNPQSLQNKTSDFLQVLQDNDIDIAFLAETWMTSQNNHVSALLRESGYNMYHSFRTDKKGGGVAILAKSTFCAKTGKAFNYTTFEVFIQCLKFLKPVQTITLVIIYRLGECSKPDFINEFYQFVEFLTTNYNNFIVCGDFNVHVNKPNDVFPSAFNDVLNTFSLQQLIEVPTHIHGNTLDLIIHDPAVFNFRITDIYVEQPDRSDHSLIFFNLQCYIESNIKKEITFRNLKNINLDVFKEDIRTTSDLFVNSCNENNFEQCVSHFNQVFGTVINHHAPETKKLVDANPKPGWIDSEFKSARCDRRKFYKKWKRTKSPIDRAIFVNSRSHVNMLSINKRKQYYSTCITNAKSSQGELFKICNSLLDNQKCKSLPDCSDPVKLANDFNHFFVKKISNIRNELATVNVTNVYVNKLNLGMDGPTCARSTLSSFHPITLDQLKKMILSRKIKTSPSDAIPAQLLKDSLDELLPSLLKLVNTSLSTGCIDGLKDAVIVPLLKKYNLDPEVFSNYRPVANILYLSKTIETAVAEQLIHHMDLNTLHINNQSAYKSSHSCETLLLCLNNDILKAFDSHKCVILLLLDLSAAFDTVDHDRLMYILFHEIGLRGTALLWFKSYLLNRRQAVGINGKISNFLDISYGVPQGSVLGPILFNIYVRSLIHVLEKAGFSAHGYADDHQIPKIFGVDFQYEAIRYSIPRCLEIIAHWMKASFLKLNSSKSQVIIFTPKNLASQVYIEQIKLTDGCSIPVTTMVTNLGVKLDHELSLAPQINSICSQSYRLLRNLASIRKFISTKDLQLLVQSIIVSRIDNCNSLLYGVLAGNINKLQKLQNACARLIFGKKRREHVTPLLKELHWLPIRQRIVFKILLLVFKFYQEMTPIYISELLHKSTRNELTLIVPRANTQYGDRAFSNCAPRLWNALPMSIRGSDTLCYFRSHLKHHLFSNFETFISQANIYID